MQKEAMLYKPFEDIGGVAGGYPLRHMEKEVATSFSITLTG